jgi:hypothetical protein
MILAIDPGPVETAYVVWDGAHIVRKGKAINDVALQIVSDFGCGSESMCAIEMIASYGMAVGAEIFETCVWIGRYMQVFGAARCHRLPRLAIKQHLCHDSRARDGNIRQALIDRLGPVGTKKELGPLYGVSGDMWAALAVAVTWWDKHYEI